MKAASPKRLFNKNYILLILVSLVTSFGYSMIATLISSYGVQLGASLTAAGALAGVYSISALVIRPFGGYATDILNKRTMCLLSTGMISLAMLGYALAPGIGVMFLVRVLHGAAFGVSGTANMAMVCEYVPENRLAEGLSYFGLGQVVSQVAGPSLGIAIKNSLGYNTLFLIISGMSLIAVFILLFIDKKPRVDAEEAPKRKPFRLGNLIAKECIVYALVAGVFSLGNGIVNSFLVMLGEERSIAGVALFFSVNAGVLFLMRLFVGKMVDKEGSLSLIVNISLVTSAISMAMIGQAAVLWVILAAAVLKAIGQGSGQISLQSACIRRVDASRVGIAAGTYYIGADIGQGLGPILGGQISTMFNYKVMFYVIAGIILLFAVVFNLYQQLVVKKQAVGKAKDLPAA